MRLDRKVITIIGVIGIFILSIGMASANFVAYNDCVLLEIAHGNASGTPNNYSNPTWVPGVFVPDMPNVTHWGIGQWNSYWDPCPAAWNSGELKDWNTGVGIGITASFTQTGNPYYAPSGALPGNIIESGLVSPTAGYDNPPYTDAGSVFQPYTASVRGVTYYGSSSGWSVTITLRGLTPGRTYEFVTSANRAHTGYNVAGDQRDSKYTISGAEGVVNTSSAGAEITNGGNTTAFNTGDNFIGRVARWTFQSGSDGTVAFIAEPKAFYKAYSFSAFRLKDVTASKISGYVRDAVGNPIAGALVVASKRVNALAAPDYAQAQTNTSGYYEMTCLDTATYYMAAWAEGWHASDETTTSITSDTDIKTANFTLTVEGINKATGATMSSNNLGAGTPANAIDGSHGVSPFAIQNIDTPGTAFTSSTTTGQDVNTVPTQLLLDHGVNCRVSEMVVYWDWAWARGYKIQCLPDGYDPSAVSTDWNTHGTTLFETTTGRPGLVNKVPSTIVPLVASARPAYDPINYVDVYKFAEQNARYWRIYATNTVNKAYVGVQEIELHDSAAPTSIGAAKTLPDDSPVCLLNQYVTAGSGGGVPANVIYIEAKDRSAGIRLDTSTIGTSYTFGEAVDVGGIIKTTAAGEKYVAVEAMRKVSDVRPLEELGMNNRDAAQSSALGQFVKLCGKVGNITSDSFTITDGSPTPIKVCCGNLTKPADNTYIKIRGILSTESGQPVLLMRDEQVDWANIDASQPLPFAGKMKTFRDFLIIGPFTDSFGGGETGRENRLTFDYISDATQGAVTEGTVTPSINDNVGSKQWIRYDGQGDLAYLGRQLGQQTDCVAYAHLYVWSPVDQFVDLLVSSDDAVTVTVNGQCLWTNSIWRNLSYDQDIVWIPLYAGVNRLLFKIVNGTVDYGLAGRIAVYGSSIIDQPGSGVPTKGLGYFLDKTQ